MKARHFTRYPKVYQVLSLESMTRTLFPAPAMRTCNLHAPYLSHPLLTPACSLPTLLLPLMTTAEKGWPTDLLPRLLPVPSTSLERLASCFLPRLLHGHAFRKEDPVESQPDDNTESHFASLKNNSLKSKATGDF